MKNILTRVLGLLLAIMMVPVFTGCSEKAEPEPEEETPLDMKAHLELIYSNASIGPQTVKTVHQLAILTSVCASIDGKGPITVTPARLNGEEITLVTLGGTQNVEGQATTMEESQLASFGQTNDYLKAVVKLFDEGVVPADKPVMVTGISLGGMIAQQLLGEVTDTHELAAVVTFGSPLNVPLDRKGVKVVRFADTHDKVPQLGEMVLRSGMATSGQMTMNELKARIAELDQQEKISATSQYTGMIDTHALSYISEPCWDQTDFLGDPEKKNELVLKQEMNFYPAPKISE